MPSNQKVSRRDFLRQSAGLSFALPTIITSQALGSQNVLPASERIGIGHIGVGGQGSSNLYSHAQNTVAVCDVDRKKLAAAKEQAEKLTGRPCAAYSDYRKLLEDKNVDAVVISTPDHWHALITIHACEAGKDVYCEKPLTLTIAEGRAMVNVARRTKRIVQTGSQQRSDYNFRRACEFVRSGRIGKVHTVRIGLPGVNFSGPAAPDTNPPPELDYDFWLGPAPKRPYNPKRVHYNFRFFWDYSGGQLTNWGAHHVDIAQWGLDMDESGPISAQGFARYHKDGWFEVPEWFQVAYKYENGVTLFCGQSFREGVTFEGDAGTIYVTRGKIESNPPEILKQPLAETDVRLPESRDHHANWLDCIKSRELPVADVETGHRSVTVCHLGNIAIRCGRAIRWDPVKEQIVADADAAKRLHYPYRAPWSLPVS